MADDAKWVRLMDELGPRFAERAARHDGDDSFVAENYAELKARGVFAAGVPSELGGAGATHRELCEMLRRLAGHCSSTALALAMHTHLVAVNAYRWRKDPAPVEKMLKRVAAENLVLVSSGGSDWLPGSGTAVKVEGGYRVNARKIYSSGSPAGDLLVTCAVDETAHEVLHFAVPMKHESVRVLDTWHSHGMRGTGSHDIQIEGYFVPDAAISGRRPAGVWNPLFHTIYLVAFPLVYAVYLGVAEAAREIAVREAKRRGANEMLTHAVGEMDTQLLVGQLALEKMMQLVETQPPNPETTNAGVRCRTLVGEAAVRTVEKAIECTGGAFFYRRHPLERLWRDVQASRFHALQAKPQARYSGRFALGLDIDG